MKALWCPKCVTLSETKILHPITTSTLASHCPYCGGKCSLVDRNKLWGFMAERFNLPQQIIKEMFAAWNVEEHPSFADYVEEMLK